MIDLFNNLVTKQEDYSDNIMYESLLSNELIMNQTVVKESAKYVAYCFILWDAEEAKYRVKWNSKSVIISKLPRGLLYFIVHTFELNENPAKYIILFTQYNWNGVLFWCHPDFRGRGPWYDWMMIQYEDPNNLHQPLSCLAQLMEVVVDSTDQNKVCR